MTTIVGIHVPGDGTYIGSDGCATMGNLKMFSPNKWVQRHGWAVGISGDFRALNVVHHDICKILLPKGNNPHVITLRMLDVLAASGCKTLTDEESPFPAVPASALIASKEGLWSLDGSLSYSPVPPEVLWASGSGSYFAIGAGQALAHLSPISRIRRTLEIASQFDAFSNEPHYIEKVGC